MKRELPSIQNKRYLGDGVYAYFDGYQIILEAAHDHGVHEIAIEPAVMTQLERLADLIWGSKEPEPSDG